MVVKFGNNWMKNSSDNQTELVQFGCPRNFFHPLLNFQIGQHAVLLHIHTGSSSTNGRRSQARRRGVRGVRTSPPQTQNIDKMK